MRYTRGVRFKERQWDRLEEFQMDTASLQKDIPIEQNRNERGEQETNVFNLRLLAEIHERCESSREEGAGATKKPLVDYDEWRAIGGDIYREERVRNMIDGEMSDGDLARWGNWGKEDTFEQWNWLRQLGLFPGDDRCWVELKS